MGGIFTTFVGDGYYILWEMTTFLGGCYYICGNYYMCGLDTPPLNFSFSIYIEDKSTENRPLLSTVMDVHQITQLVKITCIKALAAILDFG